MSTSRDKAIVLLDDEKSYVDLLSLALSERFVNPLFTFNRPLAALDALPSIDAGIIVTDYFMPELNGMDFIRQARVLKPGVPFIIATGHAIHITSEDRQHLPELKSVLHKPFGWRNLADEIASVWPGAVVAAISD